MLSKEELSKKLLTYRIKEKIYQDELGNRIGVSLKTIVKAEKMRPISPRIQNIIETFLKEKGI